VVRRENEAQIYARWRPSNPRRCSAASALPLARPCQSLRKQVIHRTGHFIMCGIFGDRQCLEMRFATFDPCALLVAEVMVTGCPVCTGVKVKLALIVVWPGASALATPVEAVVAMVVSDEVHATRVVKSCAVPLVRVPVAVKGSPSPA